MLTAWERKSDACVSESSDREAWTINTCMRPAYSRANALQRCRSKVVRGQGPHLQQLPEAGDHARADELPHVEAGSSDGGRVGAADAVDPLHDQHALPAEVAADPGDLHFGVVQKVAVEVLRQAQKQMRLSDPLKTHLLRQAQTQMRFSDPLKTHLYCSRHRSK